MTEEEYGPLKERARALATIASFENKIRILFQDYADTTEDEFDEEGTPIEELRAEALEEKAEELRNELLENLKSQFTKAARDAPSKAYEEILYSLLIDRLRRTFGYFQAIERARIDAFNMNNLVGDKAFDIDVPKITKLLSSIDEVYFVRQLCLGLGLTPDLIEQIVGYQIQREFKPKGK